MQATFPIACHSVEFPVLCVVQFLERLAGYMLVVSLALFLDDSLHLGEGLAARVAGVYLALSYAAAVPGGILIDRMLGPTRALRLAVLLLLLGYVLTLLGSAAALIGSAVVLAIGSGLFRPSVATITGTLGASTGRDRFRWLYLAVNVAALAAPALAALLHARYGWRAIPLASTAFMLLACVLVYARRRDVLFQVASRPAYQLSGAAGDGRRLRALLAFLAVFILIGSAIHQTNGTLLFWTRDATARALLGCTLPPELFAMLPGGLVLLYTPLLTLMMRSTDQRNRPMSVRTQIAAGLLISAVAYAMMTVCALLRRDAQLVSPVWVIACLSIVTLSEALIWPLGMRLVGELVPACRVGQAHGLFSLATAIGYWLAGEIGSLWGCWPHAWFFACLVAVCMAALLLHVACPNVPTTEDERTKV